jgi:hypothetical protein
MLDILDRHGALARSKGAGVSQTVAWHLNRATGRAGDHL